MRPIIIYLAIVAVLLPTEESARHGIQSVATTPYRCMIVGPAQNLRSMDNQPNKLTMLLTERVILQAKINLLLSQAQEINNAIALITHCQTYDALTVEQQLEIRALWFKEGK